MELYGGGGFTGKWKVRGASLISKNKYIPLVYLQTNTLLIKCLCMYVLLHGVLQVCITRGQSALEED